MKYSISYSFATYFALVVTGLSLGLALLLTPQNASAQVGAGSSQAQNIEQMDRDDLIAFVRQLIERILQQRAGGSSTASYATSGASNDAGQNVTGALGVGQQVQTTDRVRARAIAGSGGDTLKVMPAGAQGTILGGPVNRDGVAWWQVEYEDGTRGWSAGNWLGAVSGQSTATSAGGVRVGNTEEYIKRFVSVTPPAGLAPLSVTARANYSARTGVWKINFGDDSGWQTLTACNAPSDFCVTPGVTTHEYEDPGQYTVMVRDHRGDEYRIDQIRVIGTRADDCAGRSMLGSGNRCDTEDADDNDDESESDVRNCAGRPVLGGGCVTDEPQNHQNFTLTDVRTITAEQVTFTGVADRDYTRYSITLKNGNKYEVRYNGFGGVGFDGGQEAYLQKLFRDVGYVGSMDALLDKVQVIKDPDNPKIIHCYNGDIRYVEGEKTNTIINEDGTARDITDASFVCRSGKWVVEGGLPGADTPKYSVNGMTATLSFAQTNGCDTYAIDWGDGTKEGRVDQVGASQACTMIYRDLERSHTYQKAGTYTVTLQTGYKAKTSFSVVVAGNSSDLSDNRAKAGSDIRYGNVQGASVTLEEVLVELLRRF